MDRPNCYECKYRGSIPGDTHSICLHPLTGITSGNDMFDALVKLVSGETMEGAKKLGIQASEHGVKKGWFMWPANFDPVWLISCNGFSQKDSKP